ncbi:MAG: hypothetical protein ABIN96_01030 [Rubrivivax sp.]
MHKLITNLGLTVEAAEARRDKLMTVLQWAFVAAVGLVIAPLAFAMLASVTALVLVGGMAAMAVAFGPVLAMKLANRRMSAFLAEASAHPMPTLENELLRRRSAIGQAGERLKSSLAQVGGFVDQAEEAARRYPDAAERWHQRAAKAQALAEAKKRAYLLACKSVEEFERVVERCRVESRLATVEAAVNESLHDALGTPLNALGASTAVEAVIQRMNEAFAGLEIALLAEEATGSDNGHRRGFESASSHRAERLPQH